MKLSTRLTTLAITAAALSGVLGAQQRSSSRAVAHAPAPRGHADNRVRQDVRTQRYAAARPDVRGRSEVQARNDFRGRDDIRGRSDLRVRDDFRGRDVRPLAVADHGRPLITARGYAPGAVYGRSPVYAGARFGAERGFVPRAGLPYGWDRRVVFHGFFPVEYASYCDAVPVAYNYMLPPMAPSYDPCLFGNRVVVYDRFSRNIVFIATI